MNIKDEFRSYCARQNDIPLFLTAEWMDLICGDDWDVLLEAKGHNIHGFFIFPLNKKLGFKRILQPHLTPYSGVWINYPEGQKDLTRIAYEKKVVSALIDQMPQFDELNLTFYPTFTNWLPFYWKGFKQTTRYTYKIFKGQSTGALREQVKDSVRRELAKAERSLQLFVSDDVKPLFDFKVRSFREQKRAFYLTYPFVKRCFDWCVRQGKGQILYARDEQGNVHAGIVLVWDNNCIYYLFGASAPEYKNSGALTFLLWKGIEMAQVQHKDFDFEGSMLEPVEQFFRNFGATQLPYFQILKCNAPLLKLKSILGK
jgi:hypothetical protein